LSYDPATGLFVWTKRSGRRDMTGRVAGYRGHNGCWYVRFSGRRYKAHRLAWFYVYGCWPVGDIDHINGNPSDNRIANLREATPSQNQANSRAREGRLKGAYLRPSGKWRAKIRKDGRNLHLGTFATAEEAHAAYWSAAQRLFGEFARAA
jgi:hypothetical protein